MSELTVAGHRVHLVDVGSGTPVVLLHSGGMSSGQWRRLIDRLKESHRVLAPDFLGMGESEPWPRPTPFHFSADVEVVQAVLAHAGGAAHLVGHSYGGLIALRVGLASPASLRSLTLCEPVVFGVLSAGDPGRAELERSRVALHDRATAGTEPWLQTFIDYWNGADSWLRLPAPQREAFIRVGWKLSQEVISLNDDATPASSYHSVTCPTLILTGTRSTVAAQRVGTVLADALPQAHLEVLEGASHMAPLVEWARVNPLIERHIQANELARGTSP